jgi:hypothetical protein
MLEELATNPPAFQFLNDSVLQHRAPMLPEILPQPQLSQSELAALRTAWAGMDSLKLAMESQGAMLAAVTSRMHSAEQEVQSLKRAANPEDRIPEVKRFCVDETVRQIVRLNEERRLSAKRASTKQTLTSQERKRRGLAPAGEPRGAMLNGELYFNWRSQGPNHRPPVNFDWMMELLMHTLMLDNEMLRQCLSEAHEWRHPL